MATCLQPVKTYQKPVMKGRILAGRAPKSPEPWSQGFARPPPPHHHTPHAMHPIPVAGHSLTPSLAS